MKILVIQTAFLGDVILATPVIEKLHRFFSDAQIDVLVRKGNESVFDNHPFINRVLVRDKTAGKLPSVVKLISQVREQEYDVIINLHRFASSGIITALSSAKQKIGFDKNPLSFCYTKTITHEIGTGKHEVLRNLQLIEHLTDNSFEFPKVYPSQSNFDSVKKYQDKKYICIAPASVWFTKQLPAQKWSELITEIDSGICIYLVGAPSDKFLCDEIINQGSRKNIFNLCGSLTLLQSAALMKGAIVNYVNDSAPMHLASAIDAATIAVFCSTVPAFGFGPLAKKHLVVETTEKLSCRPCGLHGKKECPQKHFKCATTISVAQLKPVNFFS